MIVFVIATEGIGETILAHNEFRISNEKQAIKE